MDVAQLGLRVVYDDVTKSSRALVDLGDASETAARKTKTATDNMTAGFRQTGTAATGASAGITRLQDPLKALAARATGTNEAFAQMLNVIGGLAVGAPVMVAALAGIAAFGYAWNKATAEQRKAREETEKFTKALSDLAEKQRLGAQGTTGAAVRSLSGAIARMTTELDEIVARRDRLQAAGSGTGLAARGFASEIERRQREIAATAQIVQAGNLELERIAKEAAAEQERIAKSAADARKRDIEERRRELDAYRRIAEERERLAFDDAQRQALFARVDARGIPGVQQTPSFGGTFVDPASAAALGVQHDLRDTADRYRDSVRDAAEASADLLSNFGAAGREMADMLRLANSLLPTIERMAHMGGLSRGGTIALGSAAAGYSSGGALNGAASGALIGAQLGGPWGAAAGGLLGAAGGLLGAANALKEAAVNVRASRAREGDFITLGVSSVRDERHAINTTVQPLFDEIRKQFNDGLISAQEANRRYGALQEAYLRKWEDVASRFWSSLGEEWNALAGSGGDYLNAQNAIIRAYIEQRKNAEALRASTEELTRIEELRDAKLRQLINNAEQQASSALLSGIDGGTFGRDNKFNAILDPLRAINDPNMKWFDTFADYLKTADDRSRRIAEETERNNFYAGVQNALAQRQLDTAQQSLRAQEDIAKGLRDTIDALRKYSDSLKLSSLSPLSSAKRYAAAESQFEALVTKAFGGDQEAARAITSGGGNAFLQESVARFGGSARRSQDYNRVQSVVSGLEGMFGSQLAAQDPVLEELKKQTAIAQAQLGTQQDTLVQQLVQRANDHGDEAGRIIGILRGMGYTLEADVVNGNPGSYHSLPYTPPQGPASYQAAYDAYQAAHGYAADLMTYSEWLTAGKPAYATGTRFHRGGPALVGERGAELVNMPRGSSVTTSDQFSAPVVDEIRALRRDVHELMRAQTSAIQSSGEKARAMARRN